MYSYGKVIDLFYLFHFIYLIIYYSFLLNVEN